MAVLFQDDPFIAVANRVETEHAFSVDLGKLFMSFESVASEDVNCWRGPHMISSLQWTLGDDRDCSTDDFVQHSSRYIFARSGYRSGRDHEVSTVMSLHRPRPDAEVNKVDTALSWHKCRKRHLLYCHCTDLDQTPRTTRWVLYCHGANAENDKVGLLSLRRPRGQQFGF